MIKQDNNRYKEIIIKSIFNYSKVRDRATAVKFIKQILIDYSDLYGSELTEKIIKETLFRINDWRHYGLGLKHFTAEYFEAAGYDNRPWIILEGIAEYLDTTPTAFWEHEEEDYQIDFNNFTGIVEDSDDNDQDLLERFSESLAEAVS